MSTPIPTVNVNLTPCNPCCEDMADPMGAYRVHVDSCPAKPVLVPLPLEPWRSVTMTVRLGECFCTTGDLRYMPQDSGGDLHICPARPVRVTCFIGGKDWASSEVTEVDWQTRNERGDWNPSPMSPTERDAALAACRDRWAVVRAMLTNPGLRITGWAGSVAMYETRDRMYAAIADMARMEQAAFEAQERATKVLGDPTFLPDNFHRVEPERRASAGMLERYAARLIEQVCVLGAES